MVFTEQTPDPGAFVQWEGSMAAEYRYTFGQAGEAFFRALQEDGDIGAARCPACDKTFLPPRIFCPGCFGNLEDEDLVPVDDPATVERVTVTRVGLDGDRLDEPEVFGLVSFDGVDGGILHRLLDVDPEEAEAGVAVERVLEDPSEREGGITDLRGFRPVE